MNNNFLIIDLQLIFIHITEGMSKVEESPQRKAKQNIHNLGAAPKAKIVDSTKWITEQVKFMCS